MFDSARFHGWGGAPARTAALALVVLAVALPSEAAVRADGDVSDYEAVHCKAIDAIGDARGQTGWSGDILALYADEQADRLVLRVGMVMMRGLDGRTDWFRDSGTTLLVLLDYGPGGTMDLPGGVGRRVPLLWDAAVRLGYGDERGGFEAASFVPGRADDAGLVQAAVVDPRIHTVCLLYTSPSPRDGLLSRMPSSA